MKKKYVKPLLENYGLLIDITMAATQIADDESAGSCVPTSGGCIRPGG